MYFVMLISHFLYVLLGTLVRWLHDGTHHLGVATYNQSLIRGVCVDSHLALTGHGVLHQPALPQSVPVHLKLTRVGRLQDGQQFHYDVDTCGGSKFTFITICRYPDDDSLGHQSCDEERFVSFDLSVQTDHHLEVSTNKHS